MKYKVVINCKKELGNKPVNSIQAFDIDNNKEIGLHYLSRYLTETTNESGQGLFCSESILSSGFHSFYRANGATIMIKFDLFESSSPKQYWLEINNRINRVKLAFAEEYPNQYDEEYTVTI